jgi:hypothetical protein
MRGQTNSGRRVHPDVLDTRLGSHDPDVQELKHEEIDERCKREEKERRARQIPGRFRQWQPRYADHRIATFPLRDNKVPAITNYNRVGLRASGQLAENERFRDAGAFGFMCGSRNKITALDVDTTDENTLSDALLRHGTTPLIVRTASGKWHAYYKHNGEKRGIKPWRGLGLPIDVIGGGVLVAPHSRIGRGTYEIIQGSLDDLDRLPVMLGLEDRLYANKPTPNRNGAESIPVGQRNDELFRHCMKCARACQSLDELLAEAEDFNIMHCSPPEDADKVVGIARRAWCYTEEGRNRFGQHGAWFPLDEINALTVPNHQDVLVLLTFLRGNNGPDARFMIANGLTKTLGWGLQRLRKARKLLVTLRYVREVRSASGRGGAARYRWR